MESGTQEEMQMSGRKRQVQPSLIGFLSPSHRTGAMQRAYLESPIQSSVTAAVDTLCPDSPKDIGQERCLDHAAALSRRPAAQSG